MCLLGARLYRQGDAFSSSVFANAEPCRKQICSFTFAGVFPRPGLVLLSGCPGLWCPLLHLAEVRGLDHLPGLLWLHTSHGALGQRALVPAECDSALTPERRGAPRCCQGVLWGQVVGGLATHPRFQVVSPPPLPQGPDVPVRAGLQGWLGGHHVRRAGCCGCGPTGRAGVGRIHLGPGCSKHDGMQALDRKREADGQNAIKEASPLIAEALAGSLQAKSRCVLLGCNMFTLF